jgi:hypothetical protein
MATDRSVGTRPSGDRGKVDSPTETYRAKVSKLSTRHEDGRKINAQLSNRGTATKGSSEGDTQTVVDGYDPPALANPGNVIKCVVGGGVMGSSLAHENEAPFPESLVKPFVLSFCPPDGIVCDPHAGSGTTLAVARNNGRRAIGCDVRGSQAELTRRRLSAVTPPMFA